MKMEAAVRQLDFNAHVSSEWKAVADKSRWEQLASEDKDKFASDEVSLE